MTDVGTGIASRLDRSGAICRPRDRSASARLAAAVCAMLMLAAASTRVRAQQPERFLSHEEIRLLGLGLRVEPAEQTVPKGIATIVSTFLQMPKPKAGDVSPFAPGTVLKGTLRGPSLTTPLELTAAPNSPFTIPALTVPGVHTLDSIRLESNGQVLMRGAPESVTITVIDQLLVTQVTTRPLTAQEIRDKGIVFDKSNFQAYNFTAAFAVQDQKVQISFPVVLPTLQPPGTTPGSVVSLPSVQVAQPPKLQTIIPDTLQIQRTIPNLSVVGFVLKLQGATGQQLVVPPIPGVVVIPGQIGFLNQFFAADLMVTNAAPSGSGLRVTDLKGELLLPAGPSGVVGAADAPLRMAVTTSGTSQPIEPLVQPGPDGKTGTGDDIPFIDPGNTAQNEYLLEGRREGTHTIEFNITGTLEGLPGGPVAVTGRATGSVVVRNPSFTLTFTHPDTVQIGEPYSLDVTVTNTSASQANFVSVALSPQNVSGATVSGDATRTIETVTPGDSATVTFQLVSQVAGRVYAATLDSDDNVAGRFALKAGVGELGLPVSPDSLVLPTQANSLPPDLRTAALGLLGKAWSVATAPPAALPADITRFSKQIVYDRAIEVAEAGFRFSLHEPLEATATHLLFDFDGNNFARLPDRTPNADELAFAQSDYSAFDALRRQSVRGDVFAAAVGAVLAPSLAASGTAAFHQALAERVSWRPSSLSVLVSADSGGALPVRVVLVDSAGRRTGEADSSGKITKAIPFSDVMDIGGASITARLALIASGASGAYRVQLVPIDGVAAGPITVSLVYPDASGHLQQAVFAGLAPGSLPAPAFGSADPVSVAFDYAGASTPANATSHTAIVEPGPTVMGLVQQKDADTILVCPQPLVIAPGARIVAALFNKEVSPDAVQDSLPAGALTRYAMDANQVVGVALQPGRRIVFLALRDPVGPYIPRSITFDGIVDARGQTLSAQPVPIEATVGHGGVVTGLVLRADGSPLAAADVRLVYFVEGCGNVTVSSRPSDATGAFTWDYVAQLDYPGLNRLQAFDPATSDQRKVDFAVQRDGQRLNVNVVFLGRGTLAGRVLGEDGMPLQGASLRITSLTDQSVYGATSGADGSYTVPRVPVGNLLIEAVHVGSNSLLTASDRIPFAGATVTRDLTLLKQSVINTTIRYGQLTGHVLRSDGAAPIARVPVNVFYQSNSQPGVPCPPIDGITPAECPVATTTTDDAGAFTVAHLVAGQLRVNSFSAATLVQGDAAVVLPADGAVDVNVLMAGGIGTVHGVVLDSTGHPVAGASVGGGLTLTTTGADGTFVLTDVPVGHRDIVAVSNQIGTQGSATIDIVEAGQQVNVTIVLAPVAGIAGRVLAPDGATPVPGITVYLLIKSKVDITVVGTAVTDALGRYSMTKLPLNPAYTLSAFLPDFSAGNIVPAPLRFDGQVFKGDIVFRGKGQIAGTVMNADGTAPLKAAVGVSGDRVVIAGGLVGAAFEYVNNFAVTESDLATGAFSFSGVFVGPFTLQAAGAFSPDPISVEGDIPSDGATVRADLRLSATSKITGTVFGADGVTPAGANVVVRFKSDAFRTICTSEGSKSVCVDVPQGVQSENAVTDANGAFTIPLVNAGRFTLTAEDPASGLVGQIHGQVAPGLTGTFDVRLLNTATLTVHVFRNDAKTSIPNAHVTVQQIAYPGKQAGRIADASGVVVLSGGDAFAEGDFVVLATDPSNGFAGRATGRIKVADTAVAVNVYLFDASGSVFGTVVRSDGLTPVPNADVVISNGAGPLAFAQTNANGAYSADVIPVGAFTVDVFEAATARLGFGSGRVDLDQQQVEVNVTQAAVGEVTGHVLEAGSLAPLKGWNVQLNQIAPSGRFLPTLMATSGVDGDFVFPGTTAGAFSLVAQKYPFVATAKGTVQEEGDVVDVPMVVDVPTPEFGRIEGVVVNPDGSAAGNAQVRACALFCGSGAAEASVTAAPDGTFGADHFPVGRIEILVKSAVTKSGGRVVTQLAFDGDLTHVTVVMQGLTHITGTARLINGSPAGGVRVDLYGNPSSGCDSGACTAFADPATGRYEFLDVPASSVTLFATDPITGLHGSAAALVHPGDNVVDIVLQTSFRMTARVLTAAGAPAPGINADLQSGLFGGNGHAFVTSDASGNVTFTGLVAGTYTLTLTDPLGSGIARRIVPLAGDVALGDVVLDEAPPAITSVVPAASATAVPLGQTVTIVASEALDPTSVSSSTVTLTGPSGAVSSVVTLAGGDTTISLAPLAPLAESSSYIVQVTGIRDRVGKSLAATFSARFTTVDLTAPKTTDATPPAGAIGVSINTTVRVVFSEPVDTTRFRGPPIVVSRAGASVAGRVDYILGNTAVVFTPARPLDVGARYDVATLPATDLSSNAQAAGLTFSFTTTDLTPPKVLSLTANAPTVIENTTATLVADVGQADVSVVDFYINGTPSFAARVKPFTFTFAASPAVGHAGDQLQITAIATDTSGLRGTVPAQAVVQIVADQPPTMAITGPADGTVVRNGDRVNVVVHATDDVGVAQLAFRAGTGRPQDAASHAVAPPVLDRLDTFGFNVPDTALPGSVIELAATAVDTAGHQTSATVVKLTVADAVPPTVVITGTSSGARVRAGADAVAIVSASDLGGVASIRFRASGAAVLDQTRAIDPSQPSVAASFTVTVPANAQATDTIRLDATATDRAGNSADAPTVIVGIQDLTPPTVTIATSTGRTDAVIGTPVAIVVTAEDDIGVERVDISGTGAFTIADGRSVSPPLGSVVQTFTIAIPGTAHAGDVLTLAATARDVSRNTSAPVTLALSLRTVTDVTLPPSAIVSAGAGTPIAVQLSAPAPAGGLTVVLTSANAGVVTASSPAVFAAGESTHTATLTGVAAGTTSVTASIGGADRATMTVTVQGPIVSGLVVDPQSHPVAGAQVSVTGDLGTVGTTTDGNGQYQVIGGFSRNDTHFTVSVIQPTTRLVGSVSGQLNALGGFAIANLTIVSAGTITGTVTRPNGALVGAGVSVELHTTAGALITTVFTGNDSRFSFDLVPLGTYNVEARDVGGNRGRTAAVVDASGEHLDVTVAYLARGSVAGTVRSGAGTAVPGVSVTLAARSIFGDAPILSQTTLPDGTYRFDTVFAGSVTVQATDPVTGLAGVNTGTVTQDGAVLSLDISLTSYGSVHGTVYRADGVTTVPNAQVTLNSASRTLLTLTDGNGAYALAVVPIGSYTVFARHDATHGIGRATGAVTTQGQSVTTDVKMFDQGTVVVTVLDQTGTAVAGASVTINTSNGLTSDTLVATTGSDGVATVSNVLAGNFTVAAQAGPLSGTTLGSVLGGQTMPVTVTLEPTATLAGTVYLTDGQTPAVGIVVTLTNSFDFTKTATTGADGRYQITGVPLRNFILQAVDSSGLTRVKINSLAITANGTTQTQDLVFVAVGHVTGRVINPNGSSAGSVSVTLQSINPTFGTFTTTFTNAAGIYDFANIYAGSVIVSASNSAAGLLGEAHGAVTVDGAAVTLDIQLAANAVHFPVQQNDGNNVLFDIQADGTIGTGGTCVFCGGAGFALDIVVGAATTRFTGGSIGTTELQGKQLVTKQTGLSGLNVTRKIFVPRSYFARYVDLISNPTAAPITATVRVQQLASQFTYTPTNVATSSGDATLSVGNPATADHWVVIALGPDQDPFINGVNPALGWVFDGPGAAVPVNAASVGTRTDVGSNFGGRVVYEWDNVTIPPGGVVGFMHFGTQQLSHSAATVSTARLVQLPPEAIDGLSATDIASIVNFSVPSTGVSALDPLPALTGSVSGKIFNGDGVTPVGINFGSFLTIKSTVPEFGRIFNIPSDSGGNYHLATGVDPTNLWVTIPVAPFTLNGTHPLSNAAGPTVTGSFPAGSTSAVQNYVFSNTAIITGKVRRASGAIVLDPQTQVYAFTTTQPFFNENAPPLAADGTFTLTGVTANTVQMQALVPHPQGSSITGSRTVTVKGGDVLSADITLQAIGSAIGVVRDGSGNAIPNYYAYIKDPSTGSSWYSPTNAAGAFAFTGIPAGPMQLFAYDPNSGLQRTVNLTVPVDGTVTQDITLYRQSTVTGHVTDADGNPVANQEVDLSHQSLSYSGGRAFTDAQGTFIFTFVPEGQFVLTSYDYTHGLLVDALGTVSVDAATVTINLVFQGVSLPTSLTDGNGFTYQAGNYLQLIGATKSYVDAYELTYQAKDATGTTQLYNTWYRQSGNTELNGRQIVIQPSPYPYASAPGLRVTRKIYVPSDGYFARYLESFENTSAAPITFDAFMQSGLASSANTVVATSSGDAIFAPGDRWLITGNGPAPVVGDLFAGPVAAVTPSVAGMAFLNGGFGPYYRWMGLSVAPGQRVVLMHFTVQELDLAGARAAMDRLSLMPPEALVGLSSDEIAGIRTFAVPANGVSAVPPFSGVRATMTATGHVFDYDGVTPIPNATVAFGSQNRIFGPPATTTSDASGNFSVSGLAVDTYLLQATHPQTQVLSSGVTGAVIANQTAVQKDVVFSATGTLRGVARNASGVPYGAGAVSVRVSGPTLPAAVTAIVGAGGIYSVSGLPPGAYTVQLQVSPAPAAAVVTITAGATTVQDLNQPALVSLRFTVKQANGTPVVGAFIYLQAAGQTFQQYIGVATNASGIASVGNVPVGAYSGIAYTSSFIPVLGFAGTIAPGAVGTTVAVLIQPTATGTVTGHVFAGDGVTGVPGAQVYATDVASGATMGSGSTDASGVYTIPSLNQGAQGFQFQAVAPTQSEITAQTTGSFAANGATLTEDFTLALGVVRGHIFQADGGTPANGLEIDGGQAGSQGYVRRQSWFSSDNQYALFFVPGAATVRALQQDRGTSAGRDVTVTDVTQVQSVDLVMPPTGVITGTVRTQAGTPVASAQVVVSSVAADPFSDVYVSADQNGVYSVDRIAVGGFTAQACDVAGDGLCQAESGTVTGPGATAVRDITLPVVGVVQGNAQLSDGSTLDQFDSLQIVGGNEGASMFQRFWQPTGGRAYAVTGVPVGPVVAAFSSRGEAGLGTGTLSASGTLTLDVTAGAGGAVPAFTRIDPGADGFNYQPYCSGYLQGDEGGATSPYDRSYVLRVGGVQIACLSAMRATNGNREMVYGPFPVSHVLATRRVYVPAAGGFVRFLDTFENATSSTQTIDVSIESTWSGVTAFDVAPGATGLTYAVTTDGTGGASGRPVLAHVFAGPGGSTTPISINYPQFLGGSTVRYRLTVPAGAAVTLMHFSAQRASTDTAGARAQAQTLVNLTDPNALVFMTSEDKARVVNFSIK